MAVKELFIGLSCGSLCLINCLFLIIPCSPCRLGGDNDIRLVSVLAEKPVGIGAALTALCPYRYGAGIGNTVGNGEKNCLIVISFILVIVVVPAVNGGDKGNAALFIRREMDDDDLIGVGSDNGAGVFYSA